MEGEPKGQSNILASFTSLLVQRGEERMRKCDEAGGDVVKLL